MQNHWYESNRDDYLDALSPIIPPEYLMEIESLMTEFFTAYGGADVDTTGWRAIMRRTSQDALAKETGTFGCSSPQQITVNHASVLSIPSMETIMGWFRGRKTQQSMCGSCCLECCRCTSQCHQDAGDAFNDAFAYGTLAFFGCVAVSGGSAAAGCMLGGLGIFAYGSGAAMYRLNRCRGDCRGLDHCIRCPSAIDNYDGSYSCESVHRGV